MAGKKKKKRFTPTKYDWTALEAEFLAGEISSVKEFCALRGIPKGTYDSKVTGWGYKRDAIRKAGNKIIFRGLARDYADAMKTHLNWGAGAIKLALDALVPQGTDPATGLPKVGLKPTTAAEAVKILHLGTVIQKNALLTTASLEEMLRDKSIQVPGGDGEEPKRIVNVIIDLPSNGKEANQCATLKSRPKRNASIPLQPSKGAVGRVLIQKSMKFTRQMGMDGKTTILNPNPR